MEPGSVHQVRNVRWGSRLCENSDAELGRRKFVSIALNKKRTALAVTVERRKERKQFCAFSARARFHTAWVKRVIPKWPGYFRSTPMNGHRQTAPACQVCAITGHHGPGYGDVSVGAL